MAVRHEDYRKRLRGAERPALTNAELLAKPFLEVFPPSLIPNTRIHTSVLRLRHCYNDTLLYDFPSRYCIAAPHGIVLFTRDLRLDDSDLAFRNR